MSGKSESPIPRCIDAAAKAAFVAHLRAGLRREDAADAVGFSLTGFYGARARDPAFAAEWKAALAGPPAAHRRVRSYEGRGEARGEVRIVAANQRRLQRRRRRNVRFDAAAQERFLVHLTHSGDWEAAAAEAGVSPSTATWHCRHHFEFAAACKQALAHGYVALEEEAVRQCLAAQERLRKVVEDAAARGAPPPPEVAAEAGVEFDRIMRLLARRDRRPRRPARHGRGARWTFDAAIQELDRVLRGMGIRPEAPEGEGRE